MKLEAVLFDLDGTLADTAPDLGAALNLLRSEEHRPPLPLASLRPYTSAGTRGMLRAGFSITPSDDTYASLAERFLRIYAHKLCVNTAVFPALEPVLTSLEARGLPWGVVTNKPKRFTEPLLESLALTRRCACIVSGDSAAKPKPAPDPLLLAARQLALDPASILYVGDDLRDIQSGDAAGMKTAAAAWGYLGIDAPIDTWGADWILQTPADLLKLCGN